MQKHANDDDDDDDDDNAADGGGGLGGLRRTVGELQEDEEDEDGFSDRADEYAALSFPYPLASPSPVATL